MNHSRSLSFQQANRFSNQDQAKEENSRNMYLQDIQQSEEKQKPEYMQPLTDTFNTNQSQQFQSNNNNINYKLSNQDVQTQNQQYHNVNNNNNQNINIKVFDNDIKEFVKQTAREKAALVSQIQKLQDECQTLKMNYYLEKRKSDDAPLKIQDLNTNKNYNSISQYSSQDNNNNNTQEINALRNQVSQLQRQIAQQQQQQFGGDNNYPQFQVGDPEIKQFVEQIARDNAQVDSENKLLIHDIKMFKEEINELQQELKDQQQKYKILEQQRNDDVTDFKRLLIENEEIFRQNFDREFRILGENFNQDKLNFMEQIVDLQQQVKQKYAYIEDLQIQKLTNQHINDSLFNRQNSQFQNQISAPTYETLLSQFENQKKKIEELKEINQQLKNNLKELRNNLLQIQQDVAVQRRDFEEKIEMNNIEKEKFKLENVQLTDKIEDLQRMSSEQNLIIEKQILEINAHKTDQKTLIQESDQLIRLKNEISEKVQILQEEKKNIVLLFEEADNQIRNTQLLKIETLEIENLKLNKNNFNLQEEMNDVKQNYKNLCSDLDYCKNLQNQSNNQLGELKGVNEQLTKYQQINKNNEFQIQQLQFKIKELEAVHKSQNERYSVLNNEKNELLDKIQIGEQKIAQLQRKEIQQMSIQKNLSDVIKTYDSSKQEMMPLEIKFYQIEQENAKIHKEKENYQQEFDRLTENLNQKEIILTQLQNKNKNISQNADQFQQIVSQKELQNQALKNEIERLNEILKQKLQEMEHWKNSYYQVMKGVGESGGGLSKSISLSSQDFSLSKKQLWKGKGINDFKENTNNLCISNNKYLKSQEKLFLNSSQQEQQEKINELYSLIRDKDAELKYNVEENNQYQQQINEIKSVYEKNLHSIIEESESWKAKYLSFNKSYEIDVSEMKKMQKDNELSFQMERENQYVQLKEMKENNMGLKIGLEEALMDLKKKEYLLEEKEQEINAWKCEIRELKEMNMADRQMSLQEQKEMNMKIYQFEEGCQVQLREKQEQIEQQQNNIEQLLQKVDMLHKALVSKDNLLQNMENQIKKYQLPLKSQQRKEEEVCQKIQNLKQTNEELIKDQQKVDENFCELKRINYQLLHQNNIGKEKLKQMEQDKVFMKEKIESLQINQIQYFESMEVMKQQIQELEQKGGLDRSQIEKLTGQLEQEREQYKIAQIQLLEQERKFNQNVESHFKLNAEDLTHQLIKKEQENQEFQTSMANKINNYQQIYQQNLSQIEKLEQNLLETNKSKKFYVDQLEETFQSIEKLQREMAEMEQKCYEFRNQNSELENILQQRENEHSLKKYDIQNLKREIEEQSKNIDELNSENQQLYEKVDEIQKNNFIQNEDCVQRSNVSRQLQKQIQNLQLVLKDREIQIESLNKQLKILKDIQLDQTAAMEKMQLKREESFYKMNKSSSTDKHIGDEGENNNNNNTKEKLNFQIQILTKELDSKEKLIKNMDQKLHEIEKTKNNHQNFIQQQTGNNLYIDLQQTIDQQEKEIKKLNKEINILKNKQKEQGVGQESPEFSNFQKFSESQKEEIQKLQQQIQEERSLRQNIVINAVTEENQLRKKVEQQIRDVVTQFMKEREQYQQQILKLQAEVKFSKQKSANSSPQKQFAVISNSNSTSVENSRRNSKNLSLDKDLSNFNYSNQYQQLNNLNQKFKSAKTIDQLNQFKNFLQNDVIREDLFKQIFTELQISNKEN